MTPRVLIIHASTGNGHLSAANAVDLALRELGVETRVIDGLDFAPRAFRTWYGGGYEATVRMKPELWGWLYKISDDPGFAYHVQTLADSAFLNKLEKEILSFRPDVVVCTHSLPQPKVAELREKLPLKMAVVVTDLYPHLMWHRGEPDFFFLPQDWSYTELLKRYPAAEGKCMITGIPVNRAFSHALPRAQAAEAMGLCPTAPTVLLTAGGIGAGDFLGAAEALTTVPDLQLFVVCGRNDRLYEKLTKQLLPGKTKALRILKRLPVEEMAKIMHAAHLVVGKPGGLTVSEALAAGCAFVVHEPFLIPGQEEDNARFLVERKIGLVTHDNAELGATVRDLFESRDEVVKMRANALYAGMPGSAMQIATKVLELATLDTVAAS